LTVAHAQDADQILFNGKILTVDKDFSLKEALAIRDGLVLDTGSTTDMQKYVGDNSRRTHRHSRRPRHSSAPRAPRSPIRWR
jgi:hypothetical protein